MLIGDSVGEVREIRVKKYGMIGFDMEGARNQVLIVMDSYIIG